MHAAVYLELIDPAAAGVMPRTREDEFEDVFKLLLEHAAARDASTRRLAGAIAHACLGRNHLWQDLGLPGRQVLSSLMRENFPGLFHANRGNMRWKKFFYRELCRRAEIPICRAPSCAECSDIAVCFGPEEAALPAQ